MTPWNYNDCSNGQKYVEDFDDMMDDVMNDEQEETEATNEDIQEAFSNKDKNTCTSEVFKSQR